MGVSSRQLTLYICPRCLNKQFCENCGVLKRADAGCVMGGYQPDKTNTLILKLRFT